MMSAETMKIPEPIIEPATRVTESNSERPGFSWLETGPTLGTVAIANAS